MEEKRSPYKRLVRALADYFLEFVVPFIIGFSVWYWLVDFFQLWRVSIYLTYATFAVVVPGVSLLCDAGVSAIRRWYRVVIPTAKPIPVETRGKRFLRRIVGGVLIPILLGIVVNMVPVSGQDTLATLLIKWIMARKEYPFITRLGDTVISARSIHTKREGVLALKAIHSETALKELFRILEIERNALDDERFFLDMSNALASYEAEAKPLLLQTFSKFDKKIKVSRKGGAPELHERYFEQTFQTLRQKAKEEARDAKKRGDFLLRLGEMELKLKSGLKDLEVEDLWVESDVPILDVIFDAFLKMQELKNDSDIYFLANRVAGDRSYSDSIRAKAILLIAKLGGREDFVVLLPYLEDKGEIVKAATLEGIARLHKKVSGKQDEEKKEKIR